MDTEEQRLRDLQSISEAALAHLRFDDLIDELLGRITALLGTDTAAILLLDPETDELVASAAKGIEEEVEAGVRIPLRRGFAGRIAAERRAVIVPDLDRYDVVNPILREKGLRSMLGVPLLVSGELKGVLHVGTLNPRDFSAADAEILQLAADRIALAVENARLYEAERAARARAEAAAEQIRRIESISELALHHIALDEPLLEGLLARVRDVLDADTAAVLVLDDARQTLVARAASGYGAAVERDVQVPMGAGFAGRVAALGEPLVVDDIREVEVISPLLRAQVRSLAGVPLVVEERMLGVLFVGSREQRVFSSDDVALLKLAGERFAVALDHSRAYEREHYVAETLQRSLLPERLPDVPGAEVASRYLPGEGEAIGGDWYDVVPLRDGRVALAMGDVVSRGVRAAAAMGQLRNSLRAYAVDGHEPTAVLDRLDVVARGMEGRELATLAYALYEPASGALEYALAGHPPPLLVTADGEVSLLEDGRGPPLGALLDPTFESASATLEPGATLLLYTDGIVERRDMWIDEGLERMGEEAVAAAGRPAEELLALLVTKMIGDGPPADDVALLAVRADPRPPGVLVLALPAEPTVLATMRQSLRTWLATTRASDDEVYDILVATTEAAANAVEHAYGPGDELFRVEAHAESGAAVAVVVSDHGHWRPPRGQNRGRGTLLMQQLMDDFEVVTDDSGTTVRMSKRLARRLAA